MDNRRKDAFLTNAAFFIAGGAAVLMTAAFGFQYWYPKPTDTEWAIEMPSETTGEESAFERLLKKFRTPEVSRQLQRNRSNKAKPRKFAEAGGPSGTVTDRDQLLLRQKIVAELQLADCEGRPAHTARERVHLPYGDHAWKGYELDRMQTAILADRFEEDYDAKWLKPLVKYSLRAAGSDFANFEDFFWAGRANLFAGDLRQARNYLQLAKRRWPVRSGLLYGMTELMLAMTDAITGNADAMLKRVETIRTVFPDWFYSEIYQSDFEYFERAYPDRPLILMFHGRMLAMGFNDAEAMRLYRRAMAMPTLRGEAKTRLRDWLTTLKETHKK